jgi:hypothetical protein
MTPTSRQRRLTRRTDQLRSRDCHAAAAGVCRQDAGGRWSETLYDPMGCLAFVRELMVAGRPGIRRAETSDRSPDLDVELSRMAPRGRDGNIDRRRRARGPV